MAGCGNIDNVAPIVDTQKSEIVAQTYEAKRVTGNTILDESGLELVSFADPDLYMRPNIQTTSLMHSCGLAKDGPYHRRQSAPSVAVGAAFIKMIVQVPGPTSFNISNTTYNPTPHMYLGGRANASGGMSMDGGLAYDKGTQTWLPILAWNDGTRHDEIARVNGQALRIAPNQEVVMKFFVDKNQQPVLTITVSRYYLYSVDDNGLIISTKTEYNTQKTFVFRSSKNLSGWSNNPASPSNGTGQPLKAMATLAFNDAPSVESLVSRTDSYKNFAIKQYVLGKITSYNSDNDPVVEVISNWYNPGDERGDCKTQYTYASPTPVVDALETWDFRFR